MFSHAGEVMVFLFPFWRHLSYCGSTFLFTVLHASQSKSSSTINCRKRFVGAFFFFFCLPSSTTGKYEADPVYVCCNLKMSWYAVVIKEEFGAVYPAERGVAELQIGKPPWALQADWSSLPLSQGCFKMQGKDFCYCVCSLHSGNRQRAELCLYKKSGAFRFPLQV